MTNVQWDTKIIDGLLVENGRIVKGTIYIKNGEIAAIAQEDTLGEAKEVIDAKGLHVLPGLIDTHVHSRDPGPTYKEDFYYSSQAAAAGGITTILEMPNTTPPVSDVESFDNQVANLSGKAHVDFGLWGICVGDLNKKDIAPLHERGVIGFKFFWGYAVHAKTFQLMYNYKPGMEDVIPPFDDGEVYSMMKEVSKTGNLFAVHAENNHLIQAFTREVEARQGTSYDDLIQSRPELVEVTTVQSGIAMAKDLGTRLHILHVSSAGGVDAVKEAQEAGYPITVETCPHYLFLSDKDYDHVGPQMKVYPPVKYEKDQKRLWERVKDGTISHVCSDHAPHTEEEKDGELWSIPAGMCGVESLAPLLLTAVHDNRLLITDIARLLAEEPAKLHGIYPQKGSLQVGTDADFTLVDLQKSGTLKREELHSKSKVTAYDGFPLHGVPVRTIVRGKTVMKDGAIEGEAGYGQLVTPASSRKEAALS
ncbi:allantoinase AllB [Paenalkalicoccus suaedae]|uniref:allantoinase n=1 Tax=Paenalkalicoccus suaedae TaxID=2592382 RepID=A0A859FHR0_9BACI|nr:allantoinase AllB [Paenalkalicoccus suaedae]QKS72340.1 allantoinase AllB [Paenalkalicoccus suaedae]